MTNVAPSLKDNAADRAAMGLQALTSMVDLIAPGAGSFFGAMIGQVIPGQRTERMAEFATRLARRLRVTEGAVEQLQARYEALANGLSPEQRALFEDGAIAASRATTTDRIEGISKIVADGINADDLKATEQRRVLNLINDLSDEDVLVLTSKTRRFGNDGEWMKAQESVLMPLRVHMQSSADDRDRDLLRQLRNQRLVSLGVLTEKASGNGKSTSTELAPLGRYVLRQLAVLGADDH